MPTSKNTRKGVVRRAKKTNVSKRETRRDKYRGEAKEIEQSCYSLIVTVTDIRHVVVQAIKQHGPKALDMDGLADAQNRLAADVKSMREELDAISAKATQTIDTVKFKNEMDFTLSTIDIGSEFQNWMERFSALTTPVVDEITGLCLPQENEEVSVAETVA